MKTEITPGILVWKIAKILVYILMVFFAVSFLALFVWIVINSFKTPHDYAENVFGFPLEKYGIDFENYKQVLTFTYKGQTLLEMLGNTGILVLINVFCTMTIPQMAAYVFGRFEFKGRVAAESILYVLITIPVVGGASASLQFLRTIKLYDTFAGILLLQSAGFGIGMLILTSFYRGLPSSYAEAAYIDGASEFQVFTRIYYPQSMPLLSINIISTIVAVWNDYMTGYLYLPRHPILALGLQQLQRTNDYDYPLMFAGIVITMIPVFILFSIFAKKIFNSKDLGALK